VEERKKLLEEMDRIRVAFGERAANV